MENIFCLYLQPKRKISGISSSIKHSEVCRPDNSLFDVRLISIVRLIINICALMTGQAATHLEAAACGFLRLRKR